MSKDCYGSQRTRHRARCVLTAQKVKPDAWLVTGGRVGHGVIVTDGEYQCDCGKQEMAMDEMCSHCLAVWAEIYGNTVFSKVR